MATRETATRGATVPGLFFVLYHMALILSVIHYGHGRAAQVDRSKEGLWYPLVVDADSYRVRHFRLLSVHRGHVIRAVARVPGYGIGQLGEVKALGVGSDGLVVNVLGRSCWAVCVLCVLRAMHGRPTGSVP